MTSRGPYESRMNNNYLKFVADLQESVREDHQGDRKPEMVYSPTHPMSNSMTLAPKRDSVRYNANEEAIVRLTCMFEVQQTEMNKLRTKTREMEVEMKVQSILVAREMAAMREKCERSQRSTPQDPEENPARDSQCKLEQSRAAWNMMLEENASLKRENNDLLNEIKTLKSMLAEPLDKSVVQASPPKGDTMIESTHRMTDEKEDLTVEEDKVNLCHRNLNDSRIVKKAGVDKVLQETAGVVETVVQEHEVTGVNKDNEDHKIDDPTGNSVSHGCVSQSTYSTVDSKVELITPLDYSMNKSTITEVENCPTSPAEPANSLHKGTVELTTIGQIETIRAKEPTEIPRTADTVDVFSCSKNHDEMAAHNELFKKLNPINALQQLCMSHLRVLPEYGFSEGGARYKPIFTAECTLMRYTFKAEGRSKKDAKRLAAIGMYRIITEHITENVSGENKTSGEQEPVKKSNNTGLICDDTCVSSWAISHEEPAVIANVTEAPVVAVNQPRSLYSQEHTELLNKLRVSSNPAMQKLMEIGSINRYTIPDYVEFLGLIAHEEQLITEYDMSITSATLDRELVVVELTMSHLEIKAVGYGKTVCDAQYDAAFDYLTRFKLMLKESIFET